MNNQSVSVRNWSFWLKQFLGEILLFFQKNNQILSGLKWRNYKCFWNINRYRWNIWCLEWIWHWNSSWGKHGKNLISLPTYDDRSLSVSRNFSKNLKYNFPHYKWKKNVSLNLWHELNTKKLSILWLITNKNHGIIQNPVRIIQKTVRLSIFELNESIYFIFSNIFCGESIKKYWGCLGINVWHQFDTTFN